MKHEQAVPQQRKPWVAIKIEEVGKLTETILGGGGKCTFIGGDTGEDRKQNPPGNPDTGCP
jgi:hypothetical protein